MPGMPGSLGTCSGPVPIATNCAVNSSPRFVRTIHTRTLVVPLEVGDLGVEQRVVVEVELRADPAAVLEDLGRVRVLLGRHVPGLFEQRHVDERSGVALRARVAVPVPRAAEVAALLDDAHVVDAGFLQPGAGDESGETAADERDRDVVVQRRRAR